MNENRLNVVVVISHDMGQYLGCYGVPNVRSPNIDAFANSAVQFENNFCVAPQCSPSRAALWTGRYPHANGVVGLAHADFRNDLNKDEKHFAQILAENGYDTNLFGIQHVSPNPKRCGFKNLRGRGLCGRIATLVENYLEAWNGDEGPLFLQAGFFEPHRPFPHQNVELQDKETLWIPSYLPNIPEVQNDIADLEASIASADKAFGRIIGALEKKGMMDNTIIVFTVDHGIAFPHSKMTLYDPGIETALIMHIPRIEGGKVFNEMISNVDLLPTLLELLNIEVPDNIQGHSFKRLLKGEEYEPNKEIFAEKTYHTYYDPIRAIRTKKWKLIANFEFAPWQETSPDYDNNAKDYVEIAKVKPPPQLYHPPYELYDLESDPLEQENLAEIKSYSSIRDDLIRKLRRWMQNTSDPLLKGPIAQATYKKRMADFLIV